MVLYKWVVSASIDSCVCIARQVHKPPQMFNCSAHEWGGGALDAKTCCVLDEFVCCGVLTGCKNVFWSTRCKNVCKIVYKGCESVCKHVLWCTVYRMRECVVVFGMRECVVVYWMQECVVVCGVVDARLWVYWTL
jgi:hypothetical protein